MKFLNDLSQKKLARAIMCGLMVGGGMLAGMSQANAESDTAYITGATHDTVDGRWKGERRKEVTVTDADNTLNVAGTGTKVGRIENFQNMNFYSRNSGSRSQYAYRWCRYAGRSGL